jgi:hypothetical protein
MIIQQTTNSKGAEYTYFFCRGRQKGACQAPYVNVTLIEDAVEQHYAAIRFSQPFIADMRAQVDAVIGDQESPHVCCASRSPRSSRNSTPRRRT